jgi:hypothetical protein
LVWELVIILPASSIIILAFKASFKWALIVAIQKDSFSGSSFEVITVSY